jgi:multidrug resistance efflux pump
MKFKINILYLLIPAAIAACMYIIRDLQDQSVVSFFGTAEAEPMPINLDQDVYVRELRVHLGDLVKAGDTLAILVRHELDRAALAAETNLAQDGTQLRGQLSLLQSQRAAKEAGLQAKIADLQSEIANVQLKDSIEQALRGNLFPGLKGDNTASVRRISDIQNSIADERKMHATDLARLDVEASAISANTRLKQRSTQEQKIWNDTERQRLIIIAPVGGYIDQVNIMVGSFVPAHRDMLRIFPASAIKVVGFVHETSEVPFQIGDSVGLTSGVRKTAHWQGRILSISPKLVELPLRLRKFVEVRAWGREVIIVAPTDNQFYIGEKVAISLNRPVQ